MTKPKVKVFGEDSNVFNVLRICRETLEREGLTDNAIEMTERVFSADDYTTAMIIMQEYVEFS